MNVEGLSEAPHVTDVPIEPAPVDCMPSMLAAGRVAPVVKIDYYGGEAWDICDGDLARMAMTDPRLSKDIALAPDWMRIPGDFIAALPRAEVARTMAMSEGSEHARIRQSHKRIFSPDDSAKLAARIFTSRNTAKWTAQLAQMADELLDRIAAEAAAGCGEVDLVEHYSYPISMDLICEMLGLPPEMHNELRRVTGKILYSPDQDARAGGVSEMTRAVEGWVNDPSPLNEGVITSLLDIMHNDGDEAITVDEAVTWILGLVMPGYEPTVSTIASAIYEALRRPADQRPSSDTEIDAWIEETLRIHPPTMHATWRFATEDLDIGGYFIPKGAPVQINIALANRCPHGEFADDFDPTVSRGHLSFGLGLHYCIGSPLARKQARIALSAFLSRFPNARLSETTEVRWQSNWMNRRISVLPVVLAGTDSPQSDHERSAQRG